MTNLPIPAYGSSVLVLPAAVLSMTPPDGAYLRVLFALCTQTYVHETEEALAKVLSLPKDTVKNAIAYWVEGGVLTYAKEQAEQAVSPETDTSKKVDAQPQKAKTPRADLPTYSEEELADIYQSHATLRPTLEACQSELGKIFSTHEAAKMAALYECYGLDEAYLITLCAMCKKRYKESVSYVVKTALALYDDGIRSSAALDAYIKQQDAQHTLDGQLHKLFGIGEREIGKTERQHFDRWGKTWGFTYEIIRAAFDIATARTGKAGLPYINKILSDWNDNGIRTLEAVEAAKKEFEEKNPKAHPKAKEQKESGEAHSYSLDEFVDLAMQRSNF